MNKTFSDRNHKMNLNFTFVENEKIKLQAKSCTISLFLRNIKNC